MVVRRWRAEVACDGGEEVACDGGEEVACDDGEEVACGGKEDAPVATVLRVSSCNSCNWIITVIMASIFW